MGAIDIVILACFLPAVVLGIKRGLVKQIVALAVVVLGIHLSLRFSDPLQAYLAQMVKWEPFWTKAVSFSVIFLAVALLLSLLGKLVEKVIKIAMLGWLNRLLGLLVAMIAAALVVGTLVYIVNSANNLLQFLPEEQIAQSRFYTPLLNLVEQVFPLLKSLF